MSREREGGGGREVFDGLYVYAFVVYILFLISGTLICAMYSLIQ